MDDFPIPELRRIEANIIEPIYDKMERTLGKEQGDVTADSERFAALPLQWTKQDALEIDFPEQFDRPLEFYVARRRYSKMYSIMGFYEIGHLLSCNRDGSFYTGFNSDIELIRTQTKMSGTDHCDSRYSCESVDE